MFFVTKFLHPPSTLLFTSLILNLNKGIKKHEANFGSSVPVFVY